MCGGGGVLGLAVVYHGFRGGPVSCRCIYMPKGGGLLGVAVVYHDFSWGALVLSLYIMVLEEDWSLVLPFYIMALEGGELGLPLYTVYYGCKGGGVLILPLYIMALGGSWV